MRELFTITELTREFGVTTRTLRFYEDEGMLSPLRRGRQRLYRPRERTRLKLILRGKRLGLSLADIRDIIDMYEKEPGEEGQLHTVLDLVAQRRADLEQKRADIEDMLGDLDRFEQGCRERLVSLAGNDRRREAGDGAL